MTKKNIEINDDDQMDRKVVTFGLFIISLFLVGLFSTPALLNLPSSNNSKDNSNLIINAENHVNKVTANSQKTISWDISNDSYSSVYNYSTSGWEFGPTPSYSLKFANGSEIGLQNTVQFSDSLVININVPIASITSGNGLGHVGFNLNYQKQGVITNPNTLQSSLGTVFSEFGNYYYDVIGNTWNYYSSATNSSTGTSLMINNPTIFNWDTATKAVTYNGGYNSWTITVIGSLNTSMPIGRWNFALEVTDSSGQTVQAYGYNSWNSQSPPSRDLWVNTPYDPLGDYNDVFLTNILSNNLKPLNSVSKGSPFEYVINGTTSSSLDTFIWYIDLPIYYLKYSYQLVPESQQVVENGSWVWNQTLNNYVWDPTPFTDTQTVMVNQSSLSDISINRSVDNPYCTPGVDCYTSLEQLF